MDLDKIWSIVGHKQEQAQNRTKCPYHRARTLYNILIYFKIELQDLSLILKK
jgi:hypothetical protein